MLLSRIVNLRQVSIFLLIFSASVLSFSLFVRWQRWKMNEENFSEKRIPKFDEFIDRTGEFISKSNCKIIQHVRIPLLKSFDVLNNYLDQQIDLKYYFQIIPHVYYYLPLATLKPVENLTKEDFLLLKDEQKRLDSESTMVSCEGHGLVFLNGTGISLKIEFKVDARRKLVEIIEKRWKTTFSSLIVEMPSDFRILLAKQYREISDRTVLTKIKRLIDDWESWTIQVDLDPIEFSSFSNMVFHKPVFEDLLEDPNREENV